MRKILVCLAILSGLVSSILATDITLHTGVADKYLTCNGGINYEKSVLQSDLLINYRSGFYVDLWNSTPFQGSSETFGNEQDYGIGWANSILDVGITYCDEPQLMTFGANDSVYSHVKLSHQMKNGVGLNCLYENYNVMPESSYSGGNMISLDVIIIEPMDDSVNMEVSLAPVWDSGTFSLESGFFVRGVVKLNFSLTEKLSLVPELDFFAPITVNDRSSAMAISIAMGYQF